MEDKVVLRRKLEALLINPNSQEISLKGGGGLFEDMKDQDPDGEEAMGEKDEFGSYSGKLQFIPGNLVLPGELKVEDLNKIELMGEGSGGYVEKLVHQPSNTPIAMKVCCLNKLYIGYHTST